MKGDLFGRSNQEEWNGRDMYHLWGEEGCVQNFGGET